MAERAFIDTNVLVYAFSTEVSKRDRARTLVGELPEVVVSAQIVSEFTNVCLRQGLLPLDQIASIADGWSRAFEGVPVGMETLRRAYEVNGRYGFSWWDRVMLASALEAGCSVVYTEDLQGEQVIAERLRVANPFAAS